MATNSQDIHWDKEVDVIVVGFGAAGGISAITAHNAGAKVLLIEKMPHPGGISILSGGGVAFFAHIGGFAFGMATILLVARRRPQAPASRYPVY